MSENSTKDIIFNQIKLLFLMRISHPATLPYRLMIAVLAIEL